METIKITTREHQLGAAGSKFAGRKFTIRAVAVDDLAVGNDLRYKGVRKIWESGTIVQWKSGGYSPRDGKEKAIETAKLAALTYAASNDCRLAL